MSLTSLIDDTKSPVGKFFRERMPQTKQVVSKVNRSLKSISTIRPSSLFPTDVEGQYIFEQPPYSTLGTAIDYRIRYYFPATNYRELVAWQGAIKLSDQPIRANREPPFDYFLPADGPAAVEVVGWVYVRQAAAGGLSLPKEVIEGFFNDLETLIVQIGPAGRLLKQEEETLLNRYCVVLALFEQVFRAGPSLGSPLFQNTITTSEDLLAIAQSQWIEDLSAQSKAFYDCFSDKIRLEHVLNPTFAGSVNVGGADGDLIIGSSLLDVKSTINSRVEGKWLYQLIGYALLDYDNQYKLTNAGIYLTRQGRLIDWDIQSLIYSLTPNPQTLDELRRDFRELCQTQLTEQ